MPNHNPLYNNSELSHVRFSENRPNLHRELRPIFQELELNGYSWDRARAQELLARFRARLESVNAPVPSDEEVDRILLDSTKTRFQRAALATGIPSSILQGNPSFTEEVLATLHDELVDRALSQSAALEKMNDQASIWLEELSEN